MPLEISKEIYRQRMNFIIIGVTGRTGSGCSTAAQILCQEKHTMKFLSQSPTEEKNEAMKRSIILKYFDKTWHPFTLIRVRDIISTFILECKFDEIYEYLLKLKCNIERKKLEAIFYEAKYYSKCLDPILKHSHDEADPKAVYDFVLFKLPIFTKRLTEYFASEGNSIEIFQIIANNIRKHGDAVEKSEVMLDHVYSISDRINQLIKCLRRFNEVKNLPDFFVIDSFKNPIEIKFFQERYSAFYLIGITCDEQDRKTRLVEANIHYDQIESIDSVEYKRKNIFENHNSFISQDITGCIELADIYICNDGTSARHDLKPLSFLLIKYISLIKHPGLVTPSNDERLMQIAFDAKLNSGCLSRQVGAAISDSSGKLLSIGWNDAPGDQASCILRSAEGLLTEQDETMFSHYEKNTPLFKEELKQYYNDRRGACDEGLTVSYCFKNIKNKIDGEKNQVHTRSIHAEESAFLSLVGVSGSISGAQLFTTASPCVLCAKKAYHLGVSRVIYIDPYPDISFDHIFKFGSTSLKCDLFSGAIGSAYHRLYLPSVPLKDELGSFATPQ